MKKLIMIIGLCFILFPISVHAASEGLSMDCPKNIRANEEFVCTIQGFSNYEVTAIEYEFSLPTTMEKISFTIDSGWEGDEENNLVLVYTVDNKKGNFNVGSLKLKATTDISEVEIETKRLLFGDADFNPHVVVGERSKLPTNESEINDETADKKEEKEVIKKLQNTKLIMAILLLITGVSVVFVKLRKGVKK